MLVFVRVLVEFSGESVGICGTATDRGFSLMTRLLRGVGGIVGCMVLWALMANMVMQAMEQTVVGIFNVA